MHISRLSTGAVILFAACFASFPRFAVNNDAAGRPPYRFLFLVCGGLPLQVPLVLFREDVRDAAAEAEVYLVAHVVIVLLV